mmetsp:Transcript_33452/g.48746  ORF Transcript_33452/g.48746 Transcript_33452/m.48746 type:complete len:103 (-) Transcript_33452:32-340(-)
MPKPVRDTPKFPTKDANEKMIATAISSLVVSMLSSLLFSSRYRFNQTFIIVMFFLLFVYMCSVGVCVDVVDIASFTSLDGHGWQTTRVMMGPKKCKRERRGR